MTTMDSSGPVTDTRAIREIRKRWAERLIGLATTAYRERDYPRATEMLVRALALDPARDYRIEAAMERVNARAGTTGTVASRLTLDQQTAVRMACAQADDADTEPLIAWNQAIGAR
jgi:hypothetical protein